MVAVVVVVVAVLLLLLLSVNVDVAVATTTLETAVDFWLPLVSAEVLEIGPDDGDATAADDKISLVCITFVTAGFLVLCCLADNVAADGGNIRVRLIVVVAVAAIVVDIKCCKQHVKMVNNMQHILK